MRLTSTLLAGLSATVMFSCASSPDERAWQTDGGLVEDHATTISNCGVGNYLFRHMRGSCATDPTSETTAGTDAAAATDESTRVAEEQPITETRSARTSAPITDEVTFEVDSATLTSSGRQVLDGIANNLKNSEGKVTVEGHADHTGESDYNQKLSEKRAASVKSYLTGKGLDGERIDTVGYGEERPKIKADNASPEELRANRRVEFKSVGESE